MPRRTGSKASEPKRARSKESEGRIVASNTPERRFRVLADLEPMLVPVAELAEDPGNARRHPERNLEAIKASLASRGQHAPVVAQARPGAPALVRVGNGRLRCAKALGWSHVAAVIVEEDDVAAAARALADNRAGELADWDGENLVAAMAELQSAGAGEGLAFDAEELAHIRGEFAAPRNGEEVFGTVADGLTIRASVLVACRREDVERVEEALRRALETSGVVGWDVRARKREGVREVAQRRRERDAAERAAERAAAGT